MNLDLGDRTLHPDTTLLSQYIFGKYSQKFEYWFSQLQERLQVFSFISQSYSEYQVMTYFSMAA